jgi:hypothetical protein
MNISDLTILTLATTFMLWFVQRLERKRVWLGLLFVLPAFLIYRWAIYKDQIQETIIAAGIGLALNVIYYFAYGRAHPPASSDEITVLGSDQ